MVVSPKKTYYIGMGDEIIIRLLKHLYTNNTYTQYISF